MLNGTALRVQRVREVTLFLPSEQADFLVATHRDLVADAVKTSQAAPDFSAFLGQLISFGLKAVLGTPDPIPEAPKESPDAA